MEEPADVLAGRHVLLGVSGGIAAYKAAALARALVRSGATVQALLTDGASRFVGPATFAGLTGRHVPMDVFENPEGIDHVRLAREADLAVFAPATANLIAKLAAGVGDDIVTSTFLCLTCPVVLAPAMHAEMWQHPATAHNVGVLERRGVRVVGPGEGLLAGGDEGPGRLVDEPDLLAAIVDALAGPAGALLGRRVVVTAGGTREPIDPVRYIGNRSSGRMGYAVAAEAARRGAAVDLVTAPTDLPVPAGVTVHRVETALEMHATVLPLAEGAGVVVAAAAVADYRPATAANRKLKKGDGSLDAVALVPNPDILAELGARRPAGDPPLLVGFAAETHDEEAQGRAKLASKHLDLIVVNRVDRPDTGFNVETNQVLLLGADGSRREIPLTSKRRVAELLLDAVEALLTVQSSTP